MGLRIDVRNESRHGDVADIEALRELAQRVYEGEGRDGEAELSVLFCDDAFMAEINEAYRDEAQATDVLSFPQEEPVHGDVSVLGDIAISLETVARRCGEDPAAMEKETALLLCHGLLHLLGYDHAEPEEQAAMTARQARYLGLDPGDAWLRGEPPGGEAGGSGPR